MYNQDLCGKSHEEILNAIRMIVNICNANHCEACPFSKNDECRLQYTPPTGWVISEPDPTWRALE